MQCLISLPEGELFYSEEDHILKAVWHGYVGIESFQEILAKGYQICIERKEPMGILLDRRDLDGFGEDIKKYLQEGFLKQEGKEIKPYLNKIATISPKSVSARAKAKLITRIIRFAYVNLPIQVFTEEEKALQWLKLKAEDGSPPSNTQEESEPTPVNKGGLFGFFKRR